MWLWFQLCFPTSKSFEKRKNSQSEWAQLYLNFFQPTDLLRSLHWFYLGSKGKVFCNHFFITFEIPVHAKPMSETRLPVYDVSCGCAQKMSPIRWIQMYSQIRWNNKAWDYWKIGYCGVPRVTTIKLKNAWNYPCMQIFRQKDDDLYWGLIIEKLAVTLDKRYITKQGYRK